MKAAGILDKLGDDVDEDIIVEMDSMSKRLMRKQRGISKEKEAANKTVAASLRLAGRVRVFDCMQYCRTSYLVRLHWTRVLRCITLHYIVLHCVVLH
jgi:hypothetical protein